MTGPCIDIAELATVDGWPDGDPRRVHLDGCPRCRARLAQYRAFAHPPAEHQPDVDADAAVLAALEAEIPGARLRDVETPSPWTRWLYPWRSPRGWSLIGAAAAAVAAIVVINARDATPPPIVLRGDVTDGGVTLVDDGVEILEDGDVRLRWHPVADADAYTVVLLGDDGGPALEVPAGDDTVVVVPRAALVTLGGAGTPVPWRIDAHHEDDVVARSTVGVVLIAGAPSPRD